MANMKTRNYAKSHQVYLWEIASEMKISEATLTRKLRRQLSETEEKQMMNLIDIIADRKINDQNYI